MEQNKCIAQIHSFSGVRPSTSMRKQNISIFGIVLYFTAVALLLSELSSEIPSEIDSEKYSEQILKMCKLLEQNINQILLHTW